jgi:alginate O-acetyltransferase complex protein AlgJ
MLDREADKVLQGKDDYLFLINDSNQCIAQITGKLNFSEEKLKTWQLLLESRFSRLNEQKIAYFHLVVPNKECVYVDRLPNDIVVSEERCIRQLQDRLDRYSHVKIIYPLLELQRARRAKETYRKGDTHWNDFGAYIAYHCLAESIANKIDYKIITPAELEFIEETTINPSNFDLGNKLDWNEDRTISHRFYQKKAKSIFDNGREGTGRLYIYENSCRELPKAVIFGDSFAHSLVPYLAQSCRRLVLVQQQNIDYKIVDREAPDFVVTEQIERFMMRIPDDLTGLSNEEIIANKYDNIANKYDNLVMPINVPIDEPIVLNHQTAKDYFDWGRKLQERGQIDEAIESYHKAIELKPNYPQPLLELAKIYQERNDYNEAIKYYQKALVLPLEQPSYIYLHLARLHKQNHKIYQAIAAYERAAELKSDWTANFYKEYADILLEQPDAIDRALITYECALSIEQNWSASFYVKIAKLYEQKQRWKESINCYRQALKLQPDSIGNYIAVAGVLTHAGHLETAINCYRKAIELKPNNYNAYKKMGDLYRDLEQFNATIECYEKALELNPQLVGLKAVIAELFTRQGKHEAAAKYQNRADSQTPIADLQEEIVS